MTNANTATNATNATNAAAVRAAAEAKAAERYLRVEFRGGRYEAWRDGLRAMSCATQEEAQAWCDRNNAVVLEWALQEELRACGFEGDVGRYRDRLWAYEQLLGAARSARDGRELDTLRRELASERARLNRFAAEVFAQPGRCANYPKRPVPPGPGRFALAGDEGRISPATRRTRHDQNQDDYRTATRGQESDDVAGTHHSRKVGEGSCRPRKS